jgi:hypothetical protein
MSRPPLQPWVQPWSIWLQPGAACWGNSAGIRQFVRMLGGHYHVLAVLEQVVISSNVIMVVLPTKAFSSWSKALPCPEMSWPGPVLDKLAGTISYCVPCVVLQ